MFACGCVHNFKWTIAILIQKGKNAAGGPRANPTPRWALHLLSIWFICFGVSKSLLADGLTIISICRRRAGRGGTEGGEERRHFNNCVTMMNAQPIILVTSLEMK